MSAQQIVLSDIDTLYEVRLSHWFRRRAYSAKRNSPTFQTNITHFIRLIEVTYGMSY